jgi:hypothetical protein
VLIQHNASVQVSGPGNITVEGRGGLGGGNDQVGVTIIDGARIDAAAGSIRITGYPGNDSSKSVRVLSQGQIRTEGKQVRVIIQGERQEIGEGAVQAK